MSHKHHHEDSERHGAAQPTAKSESVETVGGSVEMPRAEPASPAANRNPPSSEQRERPSEEWRATLHARIQRRAYALSRTGKGGSDFDNWLQAEREFAQEEAAPGRKSAEPLQFPPAAMTPSRK